MKSRQIVEGERWAELGASSVADREETETRHPLRQEALNLGKDCGFRFRWNTRKGWDCSCLTELDHSECDGLDLFTAEGLKSADVAVCRGICNRCPLFGVCRAYAHHVWAGRLYGGTRNATRQRV
jgi:hypothetical protein